MPSKTLTAPTTASRLAQANRAKRIKNAEAAAKRNLTTAAKLTASERAKLNSQAASLAKQAASNLKRAADFKKQLINTKQDISKVQLDAVAKETKQASSVKTTAAKLASNVFDALVKEQTSANKAGFANAPTLAEPQSSSSLASNKVLIYSAVGGAVLIGAVVILKVRKK